MENKKKTLILSVVAIATFAILIIGATYAYFTAQGGNSTSANLKLTTYTTDVFTFTTGDAISIYADQSSFASGKGNAVGSTFAKASLTANNKTNTATEHYYLYLNIENNTFEYTVDESTPELILTVTDNDGNEITDISGLTHTSVTDASGATITGYDITNKSGLITIFNNREIIANPTKEEQWNIKLTFVNYNKDQTKNAGKELNAKVMIQKEEQKPSLVDYVKSLYTGTQGENNIYYHNGTITSDDGTILDANDNSYRYAGASESVNNFVCFGSDESTCPTDNLYRIIGVFDGQVKLKMVNDVSMAWDKNGSNVWSTSSINKYLNGTFLSNLGTLTNKIAAATWKVSGYTTNSVTPSEMFKAEITNATETYGPSDGTSKIGLIYVSDYGFAAVPSAWTTNLTKYYSSSISSVNWMFGDTEYTITRISSNSNTVFTIETGIACKPGVSYSCSTHPVFYLSSNVSYVSGDGTQNSPIRIN